MSGDVDSGRRRFLAISTVSVGGVGLVAAAVPFAESMQPSARARALAAPVQIDLGPIAEEQMVTYAWRGQPVFVVHRSARQLALLQKHRDRLLDPDSAVDQQPDYARNPTRSLRPEWLVVVGLCTHLGCVPDYVGQLGREPFDPDWPGGFFCPCHKSRYDLAGRVYSGVPAPRNLLVPTYRFLDDRRIEVGIGPDAPAESLG
ncbi:ubiquinol-cytochrome c reductase iron-sulfur subunit [Frateuria aurantia]